MRNLILLLALFATSALAEVSVKVNRMEASAIDNAEESAEEVQDTKASGGAQDYNSSRSNNLRSNGDEAGTLKGMTRDAASGLPTGKRQHRLDDDSDNDGLEDAANACDNDCDSDVDDKSSARKAPARKAPARKEQQEAEAAK